MKKTLILLLLGFLLICTAFTKDYRPQSADNGNLKITKNEAIQKALKHAGLSLNKVGFMTSKLEYEGKSPIYEIEFFYNNTEYNYELDAVSGEIISFDTEYKYYPTIPVSENARQENVARPISKSDNNAGPAAKQSGKSQTDAKHENNESTASQKNAAPKSSSAITTQEALSIAARHAGIAESKAEKTKITQEHEYGRVIYEVKFRYSSHKYEYDIDAHSGQILKFEVDD